MYRKLSHPIYILIICCCFRILIPYIHTHLRLYRRSEYIRTQTELFRTFSHPTYKIICCYFPNSHTLRTYSPASVAPLEVYITQTIIYSTFSHSTYILTCCCFRNSCSWKAYKITYGNLQKNHTYSPAAVSEILIPYIHTNLAFGASSMWYYKR